MTDIQRTLLSTTYNNMACHLKRCNKPHAAVQYLHKASMNPELEPSYILRRSRRHGDAGTDSMSCSHRNPNPNSVYFFPPKN